MQGVPQAVGEEMEAQFGEVHRGGEACNHDHLESRVAQGWDRDLVWDLWRLC